MRVGRILICVYNTNKDSLLLLLLLLPSIFTSKDHLLKNSREMSPRKIKNGRNHTEAAAGPA